MPPTEVVMAVRPAVWVVWLHRHLPVGSAFHNTCLLIVRAGGVNVYFQRRFWNGDAFKHIDAVVEKPLFGCWRSFKQVSDPYGKFPDAGVAE